MLARDCRGFLMKFSGVNQLDGVSCEVEVLSDFWEVFFDISSETKVVHRNAAGGLEDDLKFLLDSSGGFVVDFFYGGPGGFAKD